MARYKDQRKSNRRWIAVPVLLRYHGLRIEGFSINVSGGGIYLFAAVNLSLGTQVEIEFRPPESEKLIRTCGTVRRRAVYLYAIEFLCHDDTASAYDRPTAEIHPVPLSETLNPSRGPEAY